MSSGFRDMTLTNLGKRSFFAPTRPGLGSITIVIDCNRLQLERNRNCNRNQIFQIVV